jgi:hypothetical protein
VRTTKAPTIGDSLRRAPNAPGSQTTCPGRGMSRRESPHPTSCAVPTRADIGSGHPSRTRPGRPPPLTRPGPLHIGALIRSSCKSAGVGTRLRLCTPRALGVRKLDRVDQTSRFLQAESLILATLPQLGHAHGFRACAPENLRRSTAPVFGPGALGGCSEEPSQRGAGPASGPFGTGNRLLSASFGLRAPQLITPKACSHPQVPPETGVGCQNSVPPAISSHSRGRPEF